MKKRENKYTHLTAIEREYLSFPAKYLLEHKLIIGKVLDFGCGLGNDVELLKKEGFDITGYDPFYFPQYPEEKFDTILCFYVLNVLFSDKQAEVIMEISQLLKPGGRAYFAVRRDIKYEGFREHYVHKKYTYQCLVTLPFNSLYQDERREIYQYAHYNLQRNSPEKCIFCNPHKKLILITESLTSYAILDGYPLSQGHSLIIPKRHVANYFTLSEEEQNACWLMVNKVQEILNHKYRPDGFNVGININRAAGQKIMHSHIHLIPRYHNDCQGNNTGIRSILRR
jgi:diadenosine tetraphosphate (Ap4A) HIT family hydrolase